MSTWELFTSGFSVLLDPYTFLMVVFAIVVGTIFGALPGVSATMAVALGLPFTYSMQPVPAIVFLVAVYCSSITGGSSSRYRESRRQHRQLLTATPWRKGVKRGRLSESR